MFLYLMYLLFVTYYLCLFIILLLFLSFFLFNMLNMFRMSAYNEKSQILFIYLFVPQKTLDIYLLENLSFLWLPKYPNIYKMVIVSVCVTPFIQSFDTWLYGILKYLVNNQTGNFHTYLYIWTELKEPFSFTIKLKDK